MIPAIAQAIREQTLREGLALEPEQLDQLVRYVSLLANWNRTINLTSLDVQSLSEVTLARLIVEPLKASRYLGQHSFKRSFNWFDLGSGGGSPAIPLKILLPGSELTMVESRGRKAAFLREAIRVCGLAQARVLNCRIDELPALAAPGTVDLFTLRALRIDSGLADVVSKLGHQDVAIVVFGGTECSALQAFRQTDVKGTGADGMVVLTRNCST